MKKIKLNTVLTVLLSAAVMVVIFNAFRLAATPNETQNAKTGSYSNAVDAEGYIIRREQLLSPTLSGIMEASVDEGDRVRAGQSVGMVVTGEIDDATAAELEELNDRIDAIKKRMSESGVLMIDDSKVGTALEQSLSNLKYAAAKGSVQNLIELAEDIKTLNERRAGLTSSDAAQQNLAELTARRDAISSSLGGVRNEIKAADAGLYSENVDGLEEVLTFDALKDITPAKVASFDEAAAKAVPGGLCKIVDNFKWYIVCTMPSDKLDGIETGESYTVIFKDSGDRELSGKVTYVSPADGDGNSAVVISFAGYIENFTSLRKTKVEICKARFSGIYIPSAALRIKDGITGVYVRDEKTKVFRSVSILYRSDEFLLVDPDADGVEPYDNIVMYDQVIIDPEDE